MTNDSKQEASDVLAVLNGLAPVDLSGLEFCVITATHRDGGTYWPFERGEILVVDRDGREPFGEGRKPAKWDVDAEYVPTLAEARAIRERVLSEDQRRRGVEWVVQP